MVKVNLFFLDHPDKSGIFNLGTGRAQPFNDIAVAVVNNLKPEAGALALDGIVENKSLEYVAFPDKLKGKYQSFTQANIAKLRAIGYDQPFHDVSAGVSAYIAWLRVNHK